MNETIKKISDEFSSGNFKYTYPFMTDDIVWNMIGSDSIRGKQDVIEFADKMLMEIGNSTLINTNHIVTGEFIAVEGYCNYSNPDNKPGKLSYCDVYRFNQEKLAEITSYCIEIRMK